jgi:hypothetical protein
MAMADPEEVVPMARNPEQQLVTVGRYELIVPFSEYQAATAALSRRTEAEGDPGVLAYQFYADPEARTAGNVIIYADAQAYMRHTRMMSGWPERQPFSQAARFVEYRVLGPLDAPSRKFLADAGVTYSHFPTFAAGFIR